MTSDDGFFCGTARLEALETEARYGGFPECGGVVWNPVPSREPPPPAYGERPSMEDYDRALEYFGAFPRQVGGLSQLRTLAVTGLRSRSLRAHDVMCRMRPAAVAVTVLAEREVAGAGRLIAARIRSGAGDSPLRWARLLDLVETWEGTLFALLTGEEDTATGLPPSRPKAWTGHLWRPANVLTALAPRECARRYFIEGIGQTAARRAASAQQAAGCMPLSRELVDHVVSAPNGRRARENLAANAFTPDAVLARLLRQPGEPGIGSAVRRHDFAGGEVRSQAFLAVRDRPDLMRESLVSLLEHGQQRFLDLLAAVPDDDAALVHSLVKLAEDDLEPDARRAAYLRLATVSEPEVVWSVDLALAGSLTGMLPEVRASMARGSVGPLAEAVRAEPYQDPDAVVNAAAADMRREESLDQPLPWLD